MDARDVYYSSELALAAYADIDDSNSTISTANQQALKNAGMSDKQAQEFVLRYPEIVVHYPDYEIRGQVLHGALAGQ
jgi:hypothetical protein